MRSVLAVIQRAMESWVRLDRHRVERALFVLLCLDAALFLFRREWNDGLDALAWILLLLLYRMEPHPLIKERGWRQGLRGLRAILLGVVAMAEFSYVLEGAWLDVAYAVEWLLVIALFEIETRYPLWVKERNAVFRFSGGLLFLGMCLVVGVWLIRGQWFNAYDALLWSLAFLVMDLELLGPGINHRPRAADR